MTPYDEEMTNMTLLNNPMTIAQLSMRYPSIPWKKYINNIAASYFTVDDNEIINVLIPDFIPKFIELMNITSKRVQADYAMWRVAEYSVKYLTEDMLRSWLKFDSKYNGITKLPLRWKKCVQDSTAFLGTHALYIKKYFSETAKNNAIQMVTSIKNEFNKVLQMVGTLDCFNRKN